MAELKPKTFLAGARLVWRQQRALWLIYAANLVLASVATRDPLARTAAILNHSLAGWRLVHGFDLGAYVELQLHPSMPFNGGRPVMVYSAMLFAIFLLFVTGGLLTAYYQDRRLSPGPFFAACGEYFWRLLRLMIYFTVALVPIGILAAVAGALFKKIDRESISPFPSWYFLALAAAIIAALLLSARLWFDLAELLAVADGEDSMRRTLGRAAKLLRGNFLALFWLYLRISLIGWIGFWLGLYVWMEHLRPEATTQAVLMSQALIVFWLATRLWQRASGALWLRQFEPQLNSQAPGVPAQPPAPPSTSLEPAPN